MLGNELALPESVLKGPSISLRFFISELELTTLVVRRCPSSDPPEWSVPTLPPPPQRISGSDRL